MSYATVTGTAVASDFTAGTGTLSFAPGETTKAIFVNVLADGVSPEKQEKFTVNLSSLVNASFSRAIGTATIKAN